MSSEQGGAQSAAAILQELDVIVSTLSGSDRREAVNRAIHRLRRRYLSNPTEFTTKVLGRIHKYEVAEGLRTAKDEAREAEEDPASESHLWWGHNAEHGWCVLNRRDPRNKGDSRHLVRCRDWVLIEVSREDFGSDRFKWFKNYIEALSDDIAQEVCSLFLGFRQEFAIRAKELERQAIIESHRRFLKQRNLPAQNVRSPSEKEHRVTHCYECKHHLDNAVDVECAACGWIICRCGACGCGYGYHQRVDEDSEF